MCRETRVGSLGGPLFVFKGIKSILAKNRRYAAAVFVCIRDGLRREKEKNTEGGSDREREIERTSETFPLVWRQSRQNYELLNE